MRSTLPLRFAVSALLAALLAVPAAADEFTGKVSKIVDGDTIDVQRDGTAVRVQLFGIDAPEPQQEWGRNSRAHLAEKLLDKTVRVVTKGQDRYRRTIAEVYLNDADVSADVVKSGWAWAYVEYSKAYTTQEQEARTAKRGLWSQAAPKSPWDFRKELAEKRKETAAKKAEK
jgi:micrococcal nuclease